jgi:hypothetical protein
VREVNLAVDLQVRRGSKAPRGARKVAEAVYRYGHRVLKRRDTKRRGEMRQMVFYVMDFAAKRVAWESRL